MHNIPILWSHAYILVRILEVRYIPFRKVFLVLSLCNIFLKKTS
jgi:hypothetical protein